MDIDDARITGTEDLAVRIRLAARAAGLDERFAKWERKLTVLCAAATTQALALDSAPWPSVTLMFQLRNWIMHMRPEVLNVREGRDDEPSSLVSTQVHAFVDALFRLGAIKEIPAGTMVPVTQATQIPGVGRWAYRAAYEGLKVVDTWLPMRSRKLAESHRHPDLLRAAV
jgi:hypothetical protein